MQETFSPPAIFPRVKMLFLSSLELLGLLGIEPDFRLDISKHFFSEIAVRQWHSCPGRWWRHCPWRCSINVSMWLVGSLGGRRMVGLDDHRVLFQHQSFYEEH